jgi:hypothetical protein
VTSAPRSRVRSSRPGRRTWIQLTELGTRRWKPGNLTAASRAFDNLRSELQMALAQEIVETRGAELARAYRGVIDVSFGYRRRRRRGRGRYRVVHRVCVRFMVKRKKPRREIPDGAQIPARLFTYYQLGPDRHLCAVPTDVEEASTFVGGRAQAEAVQVHWKTSSVSGAIACGLSREGVAGTFALSCRHVFSLSQLRHPESTWGAEVHLGRESVGHTGTITGPLRVPPDRSFDAQLMNVDDPVILDRALAGIGVDGIALGFLDIPDRYSILTPRGEIEAQKVGLVYDRPFYLGRIGNVMHYILLESEVERATAEGDSGSPVIGQTSRGRLLLGMHVAGVDNGQGKRFAYTIPAWQLFDPSNYDHVSNSERWTVRSP